MKRKKLKLLLSVLLAAVTVFCVFSLCTLAVDPPATGSQEKSSAQTASDAGSSGQKEKTAEENENDAEADPEQDTIPEPPSTTEKPTEAPSYLTWEELTEPDVPAENPVRELGILEDVLCIGVTAAVLAAAVVLLVKKLKK